MWHSAMRIVSRLAAGGGGPQAGSSLIATIALTGMLALLVVASLSYARSTTAQTAREGRSDIALEAADAGINQYVSRLVEDPRYYDHWVDLAEDPRIDSPGLVHAPGTPWTPGEPWTYAAGRPRPGRRCRSRVSAGGVLAARHPAAERLRPGHRAVDRPVGARQAEAGDALDPEPDPPDLDRRLPDDLERDDQVRVHGDHHRQAVLGQGHRPPGRRQGPGLRRALGVLQRRVDCPSSTRPRRSSRPAPTTRPPRRRSATSSPARSTSASSPGRASTSRTPPRPAAPPATIPR